MNVREALYKKLSEDAQLKTKANGVFHRNMDPDNKADLPVVIFFRAGGSPRWTFADAMERGMWVVKGVGSAKKAEAIDKRCREILNPDLSLVIDGAVLDVRAVNDVDYAEYPDDERVDHIGAEYKIDSQ
jgi:hypothetical protein